MLFIYTWDINWISEYESIWGIFNKFMLANCITGSTAAHILAGHKSYGSKLYYKDLCTGFISNYSFEDEFIKNIDFDLKKYASENLSSLIEPLYRQIDFMKDAFFLIFDENFKYCPICLSKGYHAIYHQFSFLDICLIHKIKLQNICPHCKQSFNNGVVFLTNNSAFCCPNCSMSLIEYSFDKLIEEWVRNKNRISFSPFQNYEDINPIILSSNYTKIKTNEKILNIIQELFLGKGLSHNPSILLNDKFISNINFNKYSENEVLDSVYRFALKYVSRHIIKSKKIKAEKIKNVAKSRDLEQAFLIKGLYLFFAIAKCNEMQCKSVTVQFLNNY